MAAVENSIGRTLALSKEEKEELRRNTKRIKTTDGSSEVGPGSCILYRGTLIGAEFGSYECLLGNKVEDMNEEDDENIKEKDLVNVEEVKLSFKEDYEMVVKGGSWFINYFFLTMPRWLPHFRESEASFNSVAVWVWLPKLLLDTITL
ncbi:hypothetical protein PVK06_017003 [Gossypium arboreum]|uniref:DUF4283 domain-containing protein n=1 Tax=Gossypium arboreum TaxID=29729 RepID=A0ABR0Q1L2_GOSAR|nr:hypothetical protein PVK06_017003 [Gossypium arboreum]